MNDKTLCFRVQGRVQGVFFRLETRKKAELLQITGWIRNCNDGSVELEATGTEENLASLTEWLQTGPERARVDSLDCEQRDYQHYVDFTIR